MTDQKRPQLTIVGMPAPTFEEPFPMRPLTPYRDVHVPTPSHERPRRERGEVTPVYVYPRKQDPTLTMRSPVRSEPTGHAKRMAAVFVCWAILVWAAWSWGGRSDDQAFPAPAVMTHRD